MEDKMLSERVFKIISQVMNVPLQEINERSSAENIEQWDSLQHMNLILALEEDLRIKFTDEEIAQMIDVDLILKALRKKNIASTS